MGFNLSLPPPFIDPICWSCGFCLVLPGLHREFFSRREECGQNTLYCLEPLKARGEHKRSDSVESAVVLKGPCQLLLRPRGLLQYVFFIDFYWLTRKSTHLQIWVSCDYLRAVSIETELLLWKFCTIVCYFAHVCTWHVIHMLFLFSISVVVYSNNNEQQRRNQL